MQDDYSTAEFVRLLETLDDHTPASDRFEAVSGQKNAWWTSQKEHMITWFSVQDTLGSGHFSRRKPNRSAQVAYQRLQCPGALIWMAEALGETPETIVQTVEALYAEPNIRRWSGMVRAHIPWKRIAALAAEKLEG